MPSLRLHNYLAQEVWSRLFSFYSGNPSVLVRDISCATRLVMKVLGQECSIVKTVRRQSAAGRLRVYPSHDMMTVRLALAGRAGFPLRNSSNFPTVYFGHVEMFWSRANLELSCEEENSASTNSAQSCLRGMIEK